jgi:hypothetical protein
MSDVLGWGYSWRTYNIGDSGNMFFYNEVTLNEKLSIKQK